MPTDKYYYVLVQLLLYSAQFIDWTEIDAV